MITLVGKLLRDLRWGLLAVGVLLFLFEMLWARVTHTVSARMLQIPDLRGVFPTFEKTLFDGPGRIVQTLMGGDSINVRRALDMFSIGFVHPVIQTVICIWAVGRSSGAIAGEIDRGTMELLLAQPVPRYRLVLAHLAVDAITIPLLCLAMWLGATTGLHVMGLVDHEIEYLRVDPWQLGPALSMHAMLFFALSGLSIFLSALGRFRYRVLGLAVLITLVMFMVNLLGQLWEPMERLRPLTLFYYFNPQPMILDPEWHQNGVVWLRLGVLSGVGVVGYALAFWTFCRRDLPAPL